MSYAPGTKLSHSDAAQCATVLTGDNVMVTRGLGAGQMMKFADWQILADGAAIREVSTVKANMDTAAAIWANAKTRLTPAAIGSKLRWSLSPETYRVAIVTANGVLQVKSVTDGGGDVHPTTCRDDDNCRALAMTPPAPWARRPLTKTLFTDEAAWRASLPAGGSVDIFPHPKAADSKDAYAGLSDVEKVNALMKRYKIRDQVFVVPSEYEHMIAAHKRVNALHEAVGALTFAQHLDGEGVKIAKRMQIAARFYKYHEDRYNATTVGSHANRLVDARRGTAHILATIHGVESILVSFNNKIAAIPLRESGSTATTYDTFAEMGNPALSVTYRRRSINI